jgi:hypothetical protein
MAASERMTGKTIMSSIPGNMRPYPGEGFLYGNIGAWVGVRLGDLGFDQGIKSRPFRGKKGK